MEDETAFDAPGLKKLKRRDGHIDRYWAASEAAKVKGYPVKSVRLHYDDTIAGRLACAARCRQLQSEMLAWLHGGQAERLTAYTPGQLGWLIESYREHKDSPYHEVRQSTRRTYDYGLTMLERDHGAEVVDTITGPTIRRWFKLWAGPAEPGGASRDRRAYLGIQVLRVVTNFGAELRDTPARELADILSRMEFRNPTRRLVRMSFQQAEAFRKAARAAGWPSMARAVAIQFAAFLRQKDVIGEWVPADGQGGIVRDGKRWQWGLCWGDHLTSDLQLKKPTSKSNGKTTVEHDLALFPEVVEELADVADRIGPVITDETTGFPYTVRVFSTRFRRIARAAGIPDNVWNMDSRAGAVSESYDAGAEPMDVMRSAGHTEIKTSQRYDRDDIEKTTRVAKLRLGFREQKTKSAG